MTLFHFFNFLLLFTTCLNCGPNSPKLQNASFVVDYQWQFINFTWPDKNLYEEAIIRRQYIPGNTVIAGIKIYKNKMYVAMPRILEGVPVTLGYIDMETSPKTNPLIHPLRDFNLHHFNSCAKLISVQSMEIDANGTMWVLDGLRTKSLYAACPPKLVLIDLNNNYKITQTFRFPPEIVPRQNGFLNDLVIDDSEGGFAYITDHSKEDPGLIVYSRSQNRAWKLRDDSMQANGKFVVNNITTSSAAIDGIALSPEFKSRFVYYCTLVDRNLYSISTDILKSEESCLNENWKKNINLIGEKQSQSDGLIIDNTGILYYGLLTLNGVGKWNTKEPFSTSEIVDKDNEKMVWPDSFGFDDKGNLYVLANNINQFFNSMQQQITDEFKINVLKMYTGTNSYLYKV